MFPLLWVIVTKVRDGDLHDIVLEGLFDGVFNPEVMAGIIVDFVPRAFLTANLS